jgi:hypothetical protein
VRLLDKEWLALIEIDEPLVISDGSEASQVHVMNRAGGSETKERHKNEIEKVYAKAIWWTTRNCVANNILFAWLWRFNIGYRRP